MSARFNHSVLILAIALVLNAGCKGPPREVAQFGAATAALADTSAKSFEFISKTDVDRQIYAKAADVTTPFTAGSITTDAFAKQFNARIKLLRELEAYGKSLQVLASTNVSEDIDKATIELKSSLTGLNNTAKELGYGEILGGEELAIVSTAVSTIGKAIAEDVRRRAIRKIILSNNDTIQKVCNMIANEFAENSELFKYTEQSIKNMTNSTATAVNLMTTQSADPALRDDFETRRRLIYEVLVLRDAEKGIKSYFTSVRNGAKAIGTAHEKMREHYEDDSISIESIQVAVDDIVARYQDAKTFYDKVKPANK